MSTEASLEESASLVDLEVGQRRVVPYNKERVEGVIRFIGVTEFSKGTWVGIELDEPTGLNDGSIKGIRYFECPPHRGIFLRKALLDSRGASGDKLDQAVSARSRSSLGSPSLADFSFGASQSEPSSRTLRRKSNGSRVGSFSSTEETLTSPEKTGGGGVVNLAESPTSHEAASEPAAGGTGKRTIRTIRKIVRKLSTARRQIKDEEASGMSSAAESPLPSPGVSFGSTKSEPSPSSLKQTCFDFSGSLPDTPHCVVTELTEALAEARQNAASEVHAMQEERRLSVHLAEEHQESHMAELSQALAEVRDYKTSEMLKALQEEIASKHEDLEFKTAQVEEAEALAEHAKASEDSMQSMKLVEAQRAAQITELSHALAELRASAATELKGMQEELARGQEELERTEVQAAAVAGQECAAKASIESMHEAEAHRACEVRELTEALGKLHIKNTQLQAMESKAEESVRAQREAAASAESRAHELREAWANARASLAEADEARSAQAKELELVKVSELAKAREIELLKAEKLHEDAKRAMIEEEEREQKLGKQRRHVLPYKDQESLSDTRRLREPMGLQRQPSPDRPMYSPDCLCVRNRHAFREYQEEQRHRSTALRSQSSGTSVTSRLLEFFCTGRK